MLLWWAITYFHWLPSVFFPAPEVVSRAIADNLTASKYLENFHLGSGGLLNALEYTVENVVVALLISCALGITLGLTSARIGTVRARSIRSC